MLPRTGRTVGLSIAGVVASFGMREDVFPVEPHVAQLTLAVRRDLIAKMR